MEQIQVRAFRKFSLEDQLCFAELSGDFNPIHIDPITARRSLYGRVVVHGIHQILWALDEILATRGRSHIKQLSVQFRSVVCIDEPVNFVSAEKLNTTELSFYSGSQLVSKAEIHWGDFNREHSFDPANVSDQIKPGGDNVPRSIDRREMPGQKGSLSLWYLSQLVERLYPIAKKALPETQIAHIITTSRLVGMYCPGMYSIYSELSLKFCEQKQNEDPCSIKYRVSRWDNRFARSEIDFYSSCSDGKIVAFVRPREKVFPVYTDISNKVGKTDFAGQNALVIGGSRGVGRAVVSILAAGGARVIFTYNKCKKEALELVREINCAGGIVDCFELDVQKKGDFFSTNQALKLEQCNSLYYFATPPIFLSSEKYGSAYLSKLFSDFYLTGFERLLAELSHFSNYLKGCYYPSTIAIEEGNSQLREYAAAKLRAESLCDVLSRQTGINFKITRLPRLDTDQTQSVYPVSNNDTVEVMYRELLDFNSAL